MKAALWLLLGLVIGGGAAWYAGDFAEPEVRPTDLSGQDDAA